MFLFLGTILAQRGAGLRGAQERFTTADPEVGWQIATVAGLLAGVLALGWLATYLQRRRQLTYGAANPMGLCLRLATDLGLSFTERWRLWQMARALALPDPAVVLISAAHYDAAVETYCAGRGRLGPRSRLAPQFAEIRGRLFGS